MPRAALSEREKEKFRARAIRAATRLFSERGVQRVSMRALASELGCSAMTPYRYFANRDELLAMAKTESFRRFADRQKAAFHRQNNPIDRLWELKDAYVQFAVDEPHAYRVMFELQRATRQYAELDKQACRSFSYLHRTVREAVEIGFLDGDPLTLAHLLWANTHGLVSLHLAGRLTMGRSLEELWAMGFRVADLRRRKR